MTERPAWTRLPDELWWEILRCLDDATTVFTCVRALRWTKHRNGLGLLDSLWHLGRAAGIDQVWPHMIVTRALVKDVSCHEHIQAISTHISLVDLDGVFDLDWISCYVHPNVKLAWHYLPKPSNLPPGWSLQQWFVEWSRRCLGRITELSCGAVDRKTCNRLDLPCLLPQMTSLTRLDLGTVQVASLAPVLAFASASPHLVQLVVDQTRVTGHSRVSADMLSHATQWLTRQPVQVFKLSFWKWEQVDRVVVAAFLEALFSCPSMHTLSCSKLEMFDLPALARPLAMETLTLRGCQLHPDNVRCLADKLRHSNVRALHIHALRPIIHSGFECVFEALAHTQLETLTLTDCGLFGSKWEWLAPLLAAAPPSLQHVDLSMNRMGDAGAMEILSALATNDSIRQVNLGHNGITDAVERSGLVVRANVLY